MIKSIIYVLVGILTALIGWIVSGTLGVILYSGNDMDIQVIGGWAMYLCIVIVVCTGLMLSKTKKD